MRYAVLVLAVLVAALCLGGGFVIYDLAGRLDRTGERKSDMAAQLQHALDLADKIAGERDRAEEKLRGWRKFGDRYREWFESKLEQNPPCWPPLPMETKP